ncbi:MAG: long-chain-fatty-acid--CoA ligase [Blastocatellia bacterium]
MRLNQVLRRALRYFPGKPATVFADQRRSYQELGDRVRALAAALRRQGLHPGDRVAIYLHNCPEFLEITYACFEIGAVIVPLNTRLAADELVFIINDAECSAFITGVMLLPTAASFRHRLQGIHTFISLEAAEGFLSYASLLDSFESTMLYWLSDAVSPDEEIAGLFYTSGTTGMPKGVMLSHGNLWMNAMHTLGVRAPEQDGRFLYVAPMFHLATFPAVINNTLSGGAHVMMERFDLKLWMEIVERERVTSTVLVPTIINLLLNHPEIGAHDLSSLKRITYGASPMPLELLRRAMRSFPGVEFSQGYGQTESSPLLTVLLPEDHRLEGTERELRRLNSCGRPVIGVEVEIVGEDGLPVRRGEVGEVVARGPNVMRGYWKRPEETAAALRDGWLRTGDMAMEDEDGYLYLVDRKKDMIISGGENVYSTEVENALYEHPAIREAAVIGVPDEKWGEAVRAIVTLREGATITEQELIDFCGARLADYKTPKSVEIRGGELPKSGTGKILKKELRAPYWQGRSRNIN